ncbi:hypothetical protein GOV09_06935 [Candidatus Woesearchaeota archaeon]|nr:hypothetical protein [Candidatus Woesearchaeota archaeon]
MRLFGKNKDVPPDVGQEVEVQEENESSQDTAEMSTIETPESDSKAVPVAGQPVNEQYLLDMEKLKGKIEVLTGSIKGVGERLSLVSEQIGELRNMSLENEKKLVQNSKDSSTAIEMVRTVQPDQLRLDYQKLENKFSAFSGRLEGHKQFTETLQDEMKDLRRGSEVFMGTDNILKLNDEVKKDLIVLKKLGNRVQLHADKSEQMFTEFTRGMAEKDKLHAIVDTLDSSFGEMRKSIEQVRLDHKTVVRDKDISELKKTINQRLIQFETALDALPRVQKDQEDIKQTIEMALLLSRKNKDNLTNMAMRLGDDSVPEVSNYENWLASIISITDSLTTQLGQVKNRLGMSTTVDSALQEEIKESIVVPEIKNAEPEDGTAPLEPLKEKKKEKDVKQDDEDGLEHLEKKDEPAEEKGDGLETIELHKGQEEEPEFAPNEGTNYSEFMPVEETKPAGVDESALQTEEIIAEQKPVTEQSTVDHIKSQIQEGPQTVEPMEHQVAPPIEDKPVIMEGQIEKPAEPVEPIIEGPTTLDNVDSEHEFVAHNGEHISNVYQLLSYVIDMKDSVFHSYVTDDNNHFAEWIQHALKDETLADRMYPLKDKDAVSRVLMDRIEEVQNLRMEEEL